jgi:cellobiose phosphorylase
VYPYLTGSASWYLLTLLTQAFGVHGHVGDLVISPKLVAEQFDAEGKASVSSRFADRRIQVIYNNPDRIEYGSYVINRVMLNHGELPGKLPADEFRIPRKYITDLDPDQIHQIAVRLVAI